MNTDFIHPSIYSACLGSSLHFNYLHQHCPIKIFYGKYIKISLIINYIC